MKTAVFFSACLAATVMLSSVSARADSIDMSTITCGDMLNSNADDAGNLLIWLDGWLAGQADDTMLDAQTLSDQVDGIVSVCQENPSMSVMNAAAQYLGDN